MIQLESDFRDYYDHMFERQGPVYKRLAQGGPSRPEIFALLTDLGLKTPQHGLVKDLAPCLLTPWPQDMQTQVADQLIEVVVYLDAQAHRGEGKIKLSLSDALNQYPDFFSAEFIPATPRGTGLSWRYLQVGERKWWLRYRSENDWRSNVGDVTAEILCEEKRGYHPRIKAPMFAIDYIYAAGFYAVDFNTAPGLDPLRGQVPAVEIVDLIAAAMNILET